MRKMGYVVSEKSEGIVQQDKQSGATGNAFGKETAPLIAKAIGATMLSPRSNEATFQGSRVVIKCAAEKTNCVGVTYRMLERLDSVFGAFQLADGSFEVLALPVRIYKEQMRATRSRGASAGKVGLVGHNIFESHGVMLRTIRV